MLVVDSNVVVKWFVDEPLHAEARHIYKYQKDILAPEFVLIEVANVAWKKVQQKEIGADQAYEIINLSFEALPGFIHSPDILVQATKLAIELAHPIYDCLYLACISEPQDALVTGDKRFFNKVKDTRLGDRIRFLDDPDLQLPLYIPLHKIEHVIELWQRTDRTRKTVQEALTKGKKFEAINLKEMAPYFDSPNVRRIERYVNNLPREELVDLLTLGWLGQGFSGTNWHAIRKRASDSIDGYANLEFSYVVGLSCYLQEGLAQLRNLP